MSGVQHNTAELQDFGIMEDCLAQNSVLKNTVELQTGQYSTKKKSKVKGYMTSPSIYF